MLEYVFFHRQPFDQFIEFLQAEGLDAVVSSKQDTFEVGLPEDLPEAVSDRVEDYYDQMMTLTQSLIDGEPGQQQDDYHTAGVVVNLRDGKTVYANVNPYLLGRVMEVLTPEEFGEIVNAILDAVEEPDERTLCQRMRDAE